jgi:putative tricarboxylic transport membrane protein
VEQVARGAGLVGSFQFENVGGAGGMVGLPRFVGQRRGRGDALMVAGSVMVGAGITNRSPVSIKDVVPVARMTEEVGVVVVPANSDFRDIGQVLQAFRTNPGAVAVGGGSAGGTDHITLGLILKALGRNPREASYVAFAGGGPAQAAIMGGQVRAGISGYSEFAEQIKAGRMRALATTGERRSDPNLPTLKESGVEVVTSNWRGVFGAPGISAAQRQALADLMTAVHATPAWREMLATRGWDDAFLAGTAFEQYLTRDLAETEGVLRDLGLAA